MQFEHFHHKSLLISKLCTLINSKYTWNQKLCYLNVCINQQILATRLEFICAPIYLTNAGLKFCIDFICLTQQLVHNMDTKKSLEIPLKVYFTDMKYRKQSVCLHLVKIQPETQSWSTGRGLPLLHTYDQDALE